MRVLINCERSGVICRAFRVKGHEAYSCDLEPREDGDRNTHIQANGLDIAYLRTWDLMIAHPPCQHLAVSGARWFKDKFFEQQRAIRFFMALAEAPIPKICIENPVSIMSSIWRKPDQIIQPWQFGHPEAKKTCLWLKGLPKLVHTNVLKPRGDNPNRGWDNQTPSGQNKIGPSPERAQQRAKTYEGIAQAMADQWGEELEINEPEDRQDLIDFGRSDGYGESYSERNT